MCFFNTPAAEKPSETLVTQNVPAPTPPPQEPAASPNANPAKSKETQDSANPAGTGYGSLIIPRAGVTPVDRSVPTG